jgi:membrane protein required for colicin V production
MPIIDIFIALAIVVSVIIGIVRGFIKEAISVSALLAAIWAALYFGPAVGQISESWIHSQELQVWFGRILVFAIVVSVGGLLSWGIAKIVRLSALSGIDRLAGGVFGAARGVLLMALCVIAGQYGGFEDSEWWRASKLIPRLEVVADWIKIMAPKGFELLTPEEPDQDLKINFPNDQLHLGRT